MLRAAISANQKAIFFKYQLTNDMPTLRLVSKQSFGLFRSISQSKASSQRLVSRSPRHQNRAKIKIRQQHY
jgi:hypothetical protein